MFVQPRLYNDNVPLITDFVKRVKVVLPYSYLVVFQAITEVVVGTVSSFAYLLSIVCQQFQSLWLRNLKKK